MNKIHISVTRRQKAFIDASAQEVLFGGAAGGGKSYGQVVDMLVFAAAHAGSKQLILRRTYPELMRSIVRTALDLYPRKVYTYSESRHSIRFCNGSVIDFGSLRAEDDVMRYQSAEYDIIRFDELTHFTEYQYRYLISRNRGANPFPKQIKSTANPGGIGHAWVKARFIDPAPPGEIISSASGSRIFLPAGIEDNPYLMRYDPAYRTRLLALPEKERRALLQGDWDGFEGQFFPEFSRKIHVVEPFDLPIYWKRFISLDYGLDMTACHWWAIDPEGRCYIYREFCRENLILSEAAQEIRRRTPREEKIAYVAASPDLWNRRQETGESGAEIMGRNGLTGLIRAQSDRMQGFRVMREYLKPVPDLDGVQRPRLQFFSTAVRVISDMPRLMHDKHSPEDASDTPHEVTHTPESVRYGVMSRPRPSGFYARRGGHRW